MEHDIYDSLRLTATTCEKIADGTRAEKYPWEEQK